MDIRMNALKDVMSPADRKKAYAAFAALGILLGAAQVGYGAAGAGQPEWLTVTLAIYAFIGGAFGLTANANVTE